MPLITLSDLEAIYGIPGGTARRWLSEGKLTKRTDKRPYKVDTDEVEALARRHMAALATRQASTVAYRSE